MRQIIGGIDRASLLAGAVLIDLTQSRARIMSIVLEALAMLDNVLEAEVMLGIPHARHTLLLRDVLVSYSACRDNFSERVFGGAGGPEARDAAARELGESRERGEEEAEVPVPGGEG